MTRSEFLKAIRALSARYVERRGVLADRSPIDSAGKRAAFAGFYAPLHFLTVRAVVASPGRPAAGNHIDRGCRLRHGRGRRGLGAGVRGAAGHHGHRSQRLGRSTRRA